MPLSFAINQCQTLEHLIINGRCRLDQLISILSYVPKLRHLSCQHLYDCEYSEIDLSRLSSNLTSICLTLYRISFKELKLFLSKISSHLRKLRIRRFNDKTYFHAEQWKELILNFMPCLHIFDFQCSILIDDHSHYKLIEQFFSQFWIERNWSFNYYYYTNENSYYLHFISIIPYR